MFVSYDEDVIVKFAEGLYQRAASIVVSHIVLGALLGAVAGALAGMAAHSTDAIGVAMLAIAVAVIGGCLGWLVGRDRAFTLRLLAQTSLCQRQIERNTRRSPVTGGDAGPELPFAVGNAGAYPLPAQHPH